MAGFVRQVLEQSAGGPNVLTPPCGRRSSAALSLSKGPAGGLLGATPSARLSLRLSACVLAYRVDEDEQDGEEDGEEESEERDGDERRLNEKDPRKSGGQSLGYTDDALRA